MYNQKVTVLVNHCHTVSIAKTLQLANTGYSSLYTINNCGIINCTKLCNTLWKFITCISGVNTSIHINHHVCTPYSASTRSTRKQWLTFNSSERIFDGKFCIKFCSHCCKCIVTCTFIFDFIMQRKSQNAIPWVLRYVCGYPFMQV